MADYVAQNSPPDASRVKAPVLRKLSQLIDIQHLQLRTWDTWTCSAALQTCNGVSARNLAVQMETKSSTGMQIKLHPTNHIGKEYVQLVIAGFPFLFGHTLLHQFWLSVLVLTFKFFRYRFKNPVCHMILKKSCRRARRPLGMKALMSSHHGGTHSFNEDLSSSFRATSTILSMQSPEGMFIEPAVMFCHGIPR